MSMTDVKSVPKPASEPLARNTAMVSYSGNSKSGKKAGKKPMGKVQRKKHWSEVRSIVDQAREVAKTAMAAKNGSFMAVSTDEKGKVTTTTVAAPAAIEAGMAREYMKSALGDRPFKAILTQQFAVQSSSANTALSTSLAADMAATNEWSSFAALFDEVRCLEYKARTILSYAGTPTASTSPVFAMATQFQTSVSLASVLVATHHVGPISFCRQSADGNNGVVLQPVTHYGYVEVSSGKLTAGAIGPATSSTNAPIMGDWIATSATSGQAIVGYINQYSDALGASNIAYTRTFGYYYVEFRLRQ